MDRRLFLGAFILFLFETTWLLHDMRLVEIPWLNRSLETRESRLAGKFTQTKQNVRRRNQNSILWEESGSEDEVYYYDSVLTLEQSAATLKLAGETKLSLSENTLIVVEPPDQESGVPLRVRFRRGDLRYRNQNGDANGAAGVVTEEWSIRPEAGSELNIQSTEEGRIDVEVLSGKATVAPQNRPEEKQVLDSGNIGTLTSEGKLETVSVAKDVRWTSPELQRVYTHAEKASVDLQWKGDGETLKWKTPAAKSASEKTIAVSGQTHWTVELEYGVHFFQLTGKNGVSPTAKVEVWKAPVIHLLSPLPRDRVKSGSPVLFGWARADLAKSYRLEVSKSENFAADAPGGKIERETVSAAQEALLPEEGVWFWHIIGLDEDSNPIPSLYSEQVYSVENPLAAPVLHAPKLRAPARAPAALPKKPKKKKRNAAEIIWRFFVGEAQAAEPPTSYQGFFEWESVDGADHYIIEISRTPDFRSPMIAQKVPKPEYTWFGPSTGKYWWRVAAGSEGRLGLFTEPTEFELTPEMAAAHEPAPIAPEADLPHGPPVEKPKRPKPSPTPEPAAIAESTPEPPPEPLTANSQSRILAWYGTGAESMNLSGESSARGNFQGLGTSELGLSLLRLSPEQDRLLLIEGTYMARKWKKAETSDSLRQTDLADDRIRFSLLTGEASSAWAYGLHFRKSSVVQRVDDESIKLSRVSLLGAEVRWLWPVNDYCTAAHNMRAAFGNGVIEAGMTSRAWRNLELSGRLQLSYGAFAEIETQRNSAAGTPGALTRFGLFLGLEFGDARDRP